MPHTTSFRHEAYCSPLRLFFLPFSLARFGRATTHAALSPAETPANWLLSNLELALFGLTPRSPLRSSGQPAQADCIADRSCATKRGTHTTSECALSCRLSGCCVIISDPEVRVQLKVRWSVAPELREQGRADRSLDSSLGGSLRCEAAQRAVSAGDTGEGGVGSMQTRCCAASPRKLCKWLARGARARAQQDADHLCAR